MEMTLQRKDAPDWVYKAEGAANLVLSYRGSLPPFVGKVLRLQKALRSETPTGGGRAMFSDYERMIWKDLMEIIATDSKQFIGQLYILHIMSPLLGSQYVDPGTRVLVSRDFLVSVEKNVHDQRPSWRVDAAGINTFSDSALVISDYSLFPHGGLTGDSCIAVEIKPKWGSLPSSEYIAKANNIKKRVSRFRMHQALRFHEGEVSQVSEYDPLDLFSGSLDRINRAIRALFDTPQNYFRIFFNGHLIFGGLGGSMEDATDHTDEEKDAVEDLIKGIIHAEHGQRLKSLLDLVGETIFRSEMLNKLLEAQKLDSYDIEGAIHAYYNIISQPCMACSNMIDAELADKYAFLHSLSMETSTQIVREYLIAATAKDCSLMISFRPRLDESAVSKYSSIYLESTQQNFDYKACFIDLDIKPLKKMVPHYELDQKAVKFYTHMEKTEEVHLMGKLVNSRPEQMEDVHLINKSENIQTGEKEETQEVHLMGKLENIQIEI